jgi:hypothetical protein
MRLSVCFLQNATELPDPNGRLRGSGKVVRNVRLQSAKDLDTPGVRSLIEEVLKRADVPKRRGRLVIKSISTKQRPRRPIQVDNRFEQAPRVLTALANPG